MTHLAFLCLIFIALTIIFPWELCIATPVGSNLNLHEKEAQLSFEEIKKAILFENIDEWPEELLERIVTMLTVEGDHIKIEKSRRKHLIGNLTPLLATAAIRLATKTEYQMYLTSGSQAFYESSKSHFLEYLDRIPIHSLPSAGEWKSMVSSHLTYDDAMILACKGLAFTIKCYDKDRKMWAIKLAGSAVFHFLVEPDPILSQKKSNRVNK